jgi:hypothetical protein
MTQTKLTERQRFWLKHLDAADARKQSLSAYAREHNRKRPVLTVLTWSARFRPGRTLRSPADPRYSTATAPEPD